jgi:hypothetical protein
LFQSVAAGRNDGDLSTGEQAVGNDEQQYDKNVQGQVGLLSENKSKVTAASAALH